MRGHAHHDFCGGCGPQRLGDSTAAKARALLFQDDLGKLFHLSKPWFPHLQNGRESPPPGPWKGPGRASTSTEPVAGVLHVCVKPRSTPFCVFLRKAPARRLERAGPAPHPNRTEPVCPGWGLGLSLPRLRQHLGGPRRSTCRVLRGSQRRWYRGGKPEE